VRSANCLKNDNMSTSATSSEVEAKCSALRTSPQVAERIKEVLAQMGLHLGMEVPGWPPENIDELAKRFEDLTDPNSRQAKARIIAL